MMSTALSFAKASASQPPVRRSVVTYSTFMRAGIWPQMRGVACFGVTVAENWLVGMIG
jgi:hypothetical protein